VKGLACAYQSELLTQRKLARADLRLNISQCIVNIVHENFILFQPWLAQNYFIVGERCRQEVLTNWETIDNDVN